MIDYWAMGGLMSNNDMELQGATARPEKGPLGEPSVLAAGETHWRMIACRCDMIFPQWTLA
jgi:hypothetical protein